MYTPKFSLSLTLLFSFLLVLLQSYAVISTMFTYARQFVIVLDMHIPFSHVPPEIGLRYLYKKSSILLMKMRSTVKAP